MFAALLVAWCLAVPGVQAQHTPEAVEPGVFYVRLASTEADVATAATQQTLSTGRTPARFGLSSLDAVARQQGVRAVMRTFRPAGRFEARHRAAGLHQWFTVRVGSPSTARASAQATLDAAAAFAVLPEVEEAAPAYRKRLVAEDGFLPHRLDEPEAGGTAPFIPNDTYFDLQYHYHNTGQSGGTVDADIDLPEAHDLQAGEDAVVVQVMDDGADLDHPDLTGQLWRNEGEVPGNGVDDDDNGFVDDYYGYSHAEDQPDPDGTYSGGGHGTHTAGTIGAQTNNGAGVASVAGGNGTDQAGVRLMISQVFGPDNIGGFAEAFVYAADMGAVISSNSWGYTEPGVADRPTLYALNYFIDNAGGPEAAIDGGVVVFAAGNANSSEDYYPAYFSPTIAVASTDRNDQRASSSNYGTWVDVAAPGVSVLSTVPDGYGYSSGTSMACPHVSGVAALIASERPGLSAGEVRALLTSRSTSDDIDALNPGYEGLLGGRLNAALALAHLDELSGADDLADASPLVFADGRTTAFGTNAGATREALETPASCHNEPEHAPSVWWTFDLDERAAVTLDTYSSDFDTGLSLWHDADGTHPLDAEVACSDDAGGTRQSDVTIVLEAGTYYVRVAGAGYTGAIDLRAEIETYEVTVEGTPGFAEEGQRGEDAGWRMVGFPTGATPLAALEDDLTFDTGVEGDYLAYFWDGNGWTPSTSLSQPVPSGTGFIVFLFDDALDPLDPGLTLDAVGLPPESEVTGPPFGGAFALVANPFHAAYDLGALTGTGGTVQATMQVWQPLGEPDDAEAPLGQYVSVTEEGGAGTLTGSLPPWQGVFVERTTSSTTGTTFGATGIGHGAPFSFIGDTDGSDAARRADAALAGAALRLTAYTADGTARTADGLVTIALRDDASDGWDRYDATKLTPLSTGEAYAALAAIGPYADGSEHLHATMALPEAGVVEVPLSVQAGGLEAGAPLTLALEAAPEGYRAEVCDTRTGTTHDLDTGPYVFAHDGTETAQAVQAIEVAGSEGERRAPIRLGRAVPLAKSAVPAHLVLRLTPLSTAAEDVSEGGFALSAPHPNPASHTARATLHVSEAQHVTAALYDALGRRVAALHEGWAHGEVRLEVDAEALPAGVYVLRVQARRQHLTEQLVIVR